MEEDKIIENSARVGKHLAGRLGALKERHASVGDVRSIGLFSGLEIVKNRKTKEPLAPYPTAHPAYGAFVAACKRDGLFIFVNATVGVVHFNPPLIVTEEQVDECVAIIDKNLEILDKEVSPSA